MNNSRVLEHARSISKKLNDNFYASVTSQPAISLQVEQLLQSVLPDDHPYLIELRKIRTKSSPNMGYEIQKVLDAFIHDLNAGFLQEPFSQNYVAPSRILALTQLRTDFDLRKLIRYCEELNACYERGLYFSVLFLLRAVLDHVPPLFGFKSFAEVCNNYKGNRSFKEAMTNLENNCRKIADLHIHRQIAAAGELPTSNQVSFIAPLDLLLAEIIEKHGGGTGA